MGLQTAAVITGLNIAASVFKGEQIEGDALIESAIKTGADTSIKTVVAGTMEVAIRRGMINQGLEYAYPIVVGDNVWIGAGVQVMPGVTIGSNVVIGGGMAGSAASTDAENAVAVAALSGHGQTAAKG